MMIYTLQYTETIQNFFLFFFICFQANSRKFPFLLH